jgi:hypothetical protein
MAKAKKLPKVFEYKKYADPIAKGVAFCGGCPLELLLRFVPQVLGNDIVITGTHPAAHQSCSVRISARGTSSRIMAP